MTAQEQRAAATLRRQAAEQAGEAGGDVAYRAYRSVAPGVGLARRVPMKTQVRAEQVKHDGKDMIHTFGYFTRYNMHYPMWDQYGEYEESVRSGAGRQTLSSNPDVAFLVNHSGVTMARTTNGTLVLEERSDGGWHDGWLNPKRVDVSDLVVALEDRSIDQMSFAFMIPEGGGWWSDDFTEFEIRAYNIDRGDVSAVNYGASPYTDITARTAEVLNDLQHLPQGALRAAEDRLIRRGLTSASGMARVLPEGRERIEVRNVRVEPVVIAKGSSSRAVQRLESRVARTAARYVELAATTGMPVTELLNARLPWYSIVNAAGDEPESDDEPDTATVYVYDEIGGSWGVDAKTFARDLDEITVPKISVRINSPGGSVFDGIAIHSSLLHHPSKVRTYVDGLAASAASVIAMGADPYDEAADTGGVWVMPGGQMMIHDASMTDDGTAADKAHAQTYLDRQSQNIATMYAGRAGGDPAVWRELMLAETWAFADEAVDLGLADKVYERQQPAPSAPDVEQRMRRTFDLSQWRYRYAGRAQAPAPQRHTGPIRIERADPLSPFRKVTDVAVDDIGQPAATSGDRQGEATGRSIHDIERMLQLDELQ